MLELPRDKRKLRELDKRVGSWIAATRANLRRATDWIRWVKAGDVGLPTPTETDALLYRDADRFVGAHDRTDLIARQFAPDEADNFRSAMTVIAESGRTIGDQFNELARPGVLDADVDALVAEHPHYAGYDREELRAQMAWRMANMRVADAHRRMAGALAAALKLVEVLERRIQTELDRRAGVEPVAQGAADAAGNGEREEGDAANAGRKPPKKPPKPRKNKGAGRPPSVEYDKAQEEADLWDEWQDYKASGRGQMIDFCKDVRKRTEWKGMTLEGLKKLFNRVYAYHKRGIIDAD